MPSPARQTGQGFPDGKQVVLLTLHGLFSHVPQTRLGPTGCGNSNYRNPRPIARLLIFPLRFSYLSSLELF